VTVAYFDCFAGISGDMTLGALLDAGADGSVLEASVEALGLGGEVTVAVRREKRGHVGGTRVVLSTRDGPTRNLSELHRVVEAADLPERVRDRSLAAIQRLGVAESRIHGVPTEQVHLHELGGADTLVDLVGSFWLLDSIGIEALYASPLPAPRGQSGGLPLPAPASLRVLEGTGAVLEPVDGGDELVTPTGAAILAGNARFERPAIVLDRVGYGIGARDVPGNALAIWVGELAMEAAAVSVLETNIDDMPPNQLSALVEDLMAAGALDVTVTQVLMKKGRPGHVVSVICEPSAAAQLAGELLTRSTTLGLRLTQAGRIVAGRRVIEVKTAAGTARVKIKEVAGEAIDVSPEYEDCRRLAIVSGMDIRRVMRLVERAARDQLGIA
jgi:uncharacterized protein (TIGR00299 family) protein